MYFLIFKKRLIKISYICYTNNSSKRYFRFMEKPIRVKAMLLEEVLFAHPDLIAKTDTEIQFR